MSEYLEPLAFRLVGEPDRKIVTGLRKESLEHAVTAAKLVLHRGKDRSAMAGHLVQPPELHAELDLRIVHVAPVSGSIEGAIGEDDRLLDAAAPHRIPRLVSAVLVRRVLVPAHELIGNRSERLGLASARRFPVESRVAVPSGQRRAVAIAADLAGHLQLERPVLVKLRHDLRADKFAVRPGTDRAAAFIRTAVLLQHENLVGQPLSKFRSPDDAKAPVVHLALGLAAESGLRTTCLIVDAPDAKLVVIRVVRPEEVQRRTIIEMVCAADHIAVECPRIVIGRPVVKEMIETVEVMDVLPPDRKVEGPVEEIPALEEEVVDDDLVRPRVLVRGRPEIMAELIDETDAQTELADIRLAVRLAPDPRTETELVAVGRAFLRKRHPTARKTRYVIYDLLPDADVRPRIKIKAALRNKCERQRKNED